jgi:hypothetical protein
MREMVSVRQYAKRFDSMARYVRRTDVQRKAKEARRAVRNVFDSKGAPIELLRWAYLADVSTPDKRFDALAWMCAFHACRLLDTYSDGRPGGTQDGPAHAITQMFYEAITRQPQSETSCLGAVKSVLAWRKSCANLNRSAE